MINDNTQPSHQNRLDQILAELEDQLSPRKSAPKKRGLFGGMNTKVLGILSFFLLLVGITTTAYVVQQDSELRNQAAGTQTLIAQQQVAGFSCNDDRCILANQDWHSCPEGYEYVGPPDSPQACRNCAFGGSFCDEKPITGSIYCSQNPQQGHMFFCPSGTDGVCLGDSTFDQEIGPFTPGQEFQPEQYMNRGCGVYQFDFRDQYSQGAATSNCGAASYRLSNDCSPGASTPPGGGGGSTPTPTPTPPSSLCEVSVVLQTLDGSEATGDQAVVKENSDFTLRARVNGNTQTVNNVRIELRNITPAGPTLTPQYVIDTANPYLGTFHIGSLGNLTITRARFRAVVNLDGSNGVNACESEFTVIVQKDGATPTPTPTTRPTPTPTPNPICGSQCQNDADCGPSLSPQGGMICYRNPQTGIGNNSGVCRLAINPTSTTCQPPAAPICASISMLQLTPNRDLQIGDRVNFVCGNVAGISRYEFRVGPRNGRMVSLPASANTPNISQPYTIQSYGDFVAQCRVCTGTDASSCSQWEDTP